jgi:phosphoribosyl-AMP cyclohydrolase
MSGLDPAIAGRLTRNADGLVCAVVQQRGTGEVLMVAWMDDEALHRTLTTGRATYWSRSRRTYWIKGETSGHTQHVHEVRLDCDGDSLLVVVDQTGPACHTGSHTCFSSKLPVSGVECENTVTHSQAASEVALQVRGDRGDHRVMVCGSQRFEANHVPDHPQSGDLGAAQRRA